MNPLVSIVVPVYNGERYIDDCMKRLLEQTYAPLEILLVDDVISTGESMSALEALVTKAGGIICGRAAILAEGDAQDRPDIVYLEKLPLFHPDGTIME